MKTGTVLVATLFALTSFPLLARQSPPDSQPTSPTTQQDSPPGAQAQPEQPVPDNQPSSPAERPNNPAEQQGNQATSPESTQAASPASSASTEDMRPVQAQLVSKLDTQTAKTGDDIIVETKNSVKTANGTEIPKGTKLVGHIVAVQPSNGGTNSQVALQIDQAELKDGQKLPIHSEIQSIEPPVGEASASEPSGMDRPSMSGPPVGTAQPGASGSANGASQGAAGPPATPGYAPESSSGMGNAAPVAGTVVGRNGNITIKTTSVPGVLLANNAPGKQDPRMSQASGILLGAKKDVRLDGGTEMTLAVATLPGGGTQ